MGIFSWLSGNTNEPEEEVTKEFDVSIMDAEAIVERCDEETNKVDCDMVYDTLSKKDKKYIDRQKEAQAIEIQGGKS